MVQKNDFYVRLSVNMCVSEIISPHHHRTKHCGKDGNYNSLFIQHSWGIGSTNLAAPYKVTNRKRL
jgi:hypothetical protein